MKTWRTMVATVLVLILAGTARAATQYWDTASSTGIQGGDGNWSTSDANWSDARTGTALSAWTSGNAAWFVPPTNGLPSTVNLSSSLSVGSLVITGGVYNLNVTGGGQLTGGTAASTIGLNGSNNTVTLNANTLWDRGNQALTVGSGAGATGNVLTVNGGTITGGLITVGANGAGFNAMTASNATLWSAGLTIGNGGTNTVTVLANTVWDMLAGTVSVNANSNQFTINGGVVSNAGLATISSGGSSLVISNGGQFYSTNTLTINGYYQVGGLGAASVVNNGSAASTINNGAQVLVTNATWTATLNSVSWVAGGAATITVASNGFWNAGGADMRLRSNNRVLIDAGSATVYQIQLNGSSSSLIITNGGMLTTGARFLNVTLEGSGTANNNLLLVSGTNSLLNLSGAGFNIARDGAASIVGNYAGNVFRIENGGVVTNPGNVGGAYIGVAWAGGRSGSKFVGNSMIISNGGKMFFGGSTISMAVGMLGNSTNTAAAISNNITVAGGGALVDVANQGLLIGYLNSVSPGTATVNLVTVDGLGVAGGAQMTRVGGVTISAYGGMGNGLVVTNGGAVSGVSSVDIGLSGSSSNNFVVIDGGALSAAGTTFTNTAAITLGNAGGGYNFMTVTNATVSSGSLTVGNNSSNNTVTVNPNAAWSISGRTLVGAGAAANNQLTLNGGTLTVGSLVVTSANNAVVFNGGVLNSTGTTNNNGLAFTVGNGTSFAHYNAVSGTHLFTNGATDGLIVSSNAWLTGKSTILASGNIVLTNGTVISPGLGTNGIGTLTLSSVSGQNGTVYDVHIAGVSGSAGTTWDLLNINGTLTNSSAANNTNFIIRMNTLGVPVSNYRTNGAYALKIATFTTPVALNNFALDTSGFVTSGGLGAWYLAADSGNLYLKQDGFTLKGTTFVWTNGANASWSAASAWTNLAAPAVGGGADYVLQFDTNSAGTTYSANNDRAGGGSFTNNVIAFNNTASGTNYLTGSSITFAGSTNPAGFYQLNSSAFIVSNTVNLATDIVFDGAGLGPVTLASNITGTGQITVQGGYNIALRGSNTFTGPVVLNGSGTLTLGALSAAGANPIVVNSGAIFASPATTSYIVGNGWSNQSVLVNGTGAQWTNTAAFNIGSGAATGNGVTLANGGTLSATAVNIGNSATAFGNGLVVSNGGNVAGGATINVGAAAGATGNFFNVLGGGTGAVSAVTVGSGVGFNTLTVTNATLRSGAATIGNSGSTNTASVLANGTWNLQGGIIQVGTGTAKGNVLAVNGGTVMSGNVDLGNGAGLSGNSVIVTNGGSFFSGNVIVGGSNNLYAIHGAGTVTNGLIKVGYSVGGFAQMTVANATLQSAGLFIGDGVSSNTVTVADNVSWNMLGGNLTFGNGSGNTLAVSPNSTVNNAGLALAGAGLNFTLTNNILTGYGVDVMTARVYLAGGQISVGGGGSSLTISNTIFNTALGSAYVGSGSSSNTLTILPGTVWTFAAPGGGDTLNVGTGAGVSNNVMRIDGGGVSGAAAVNSIRGLNVGGSGATFNNLIITNGGQLSQATRAATIGGPAGGSVPGGNNNTMVVVGGGSGGAAALWTLGLMNIIVGDSNGGIGGGIGNALRIDGNGVAGGAVVNNVKGVTVGNSAAFNTLIVTNGGKLSSQPNGSDVAIWTNFVGHGGSSNTLTLVGGGSGGAVSLWDAGAFWNGGSVPGPTIIGFGAATGNVLNVNSGGVVSNVSPLIIGSGAGISNAVTVNGGSLYAGTITSGNSLGNTFTLTGGGSVTPTTLSLTNTTFSFNVLGGTLNAQTMLVSNGVPFVVGDGTQSAALQLLGGGGTRLFVDGLTITNNATLTGVGSLQATTTVYGAVQPGLSGIGSVTNIGDFTLASGALSTFKLAAATTPGVGWDQLCVSNGTLRLGGSLSIVLTNSFMPTRTQSFIIMTNAGASVVNTFASGGTANVYSNSSTKLAGFMQVGISNTYVVVTGFQLPQRGTTFTFR